MFDLFRRKDAATRYVLGGILILIAFMLVVTLIPGFGSMGSGDPTGATDVLAQFGDEKITVRQAVNEIQRIVRSQNIPTGSVRTIAGNFADSLIASRAMAYQARKMGLDPSEEELFEAMKTQIPQLFPNGVFAGPEVYNSFARNMGLSPAQLEENFRRQMRVVRLTNMIQDGALVSEAEIERDFRETNEKIKLEYIQVPPDAYSKQVNVTEERIQEIYAKEKASFMNPQRYSLTLVVLDEARTAQGIAIPESALRAAYDQNPARFRDEPRADVRHILLSTQGKSPAELPAIEAKMADIVKKLRGGADFAALAKQFSEDPGSKDKGGLYENVPPKMMVPAFDNATFNQKVGEIGNPIRTDFGLHVLQVMKRTEARQRTFEEARETLRAELASQQVSSRMLTNANELRANLAKSTANLEELARRYNAALIPIDKQVLNGNYPEIGFNNEIGTAVVTMKPGAVGTVMTGQNGRLFIPILRESIPPAQMTLEEARAQIRTVETTRQAVALQTRKTQELADRAKQPGASFEALAKEFNAVYKSPDSFGRFGALEGVGSAATVLDAFKLPVGGVLGPMLLDGKQHVFRVVAREDADMSKLPAERQAVLERVKTRKSRERGDVFEDGLVNELLRRGEAKIYPGAKEKVTAFFQ